VEDEEEGACKLVGNAFVVWACSSLVGFGFVDCKLGVSEVAGRRGL
jgi:hypothetical protein